MPAAPARASAALPVHSAAARRYPDSAAASAARSHAAPSADSHSAAAFSADSAARLCATAAAQSSPALPYSDATMPARSYSTAASAAFYSPRSATASIRMCSAWPLSARATTIRLPPAMMPTSKTSRA